MARVLILGAGGMMGHKLCQLLTGHERIGTVRKDADAYRRFPQVFDGVEFIGGVDVMQHEALDRTLRDLAPDVIVNCVGIVRQFEAQSNDPYLAVGINAYLPHRLAHLCAEIGSRVIHLSTDCVFDGTRGDYREDDEPTGYDMYSRTKFLGETLPKETAAMTIRSSIVGRELTPPKHGLFEWFFAQRGTTIRGFANAIYTGFTTHEMARIIDMVIDEHPDLCGTFQIASDKINKYDLLLLVRRRLDLDIEIERDEEFHCDRSLLTGAFAQLTGYRAPTWDEMIDEMGRDTTPYDDWSS